MQFFIFFYPILYLLNTKPLVSAKKLSKSHVWVNCFDLVLLSAQHFNSVLGGDNILDQTLFHSPAKTIEGLKNVHVNRASLVWNDSFRKRDSLAVDYCSEKINGDGTGVCYCIASKWQYILPLLWELHYFYTAWHLTWTWSNNRNWTGKLFEVWLYDMATLYFLSSRDETWLLYSLALTWLYQQCCLELLLPDS